MFTWTLSHKHMIYIILHAKRVLPPLSRYWLDVAEITVMAEMSLNFSVLLWSCFVDLGSQFFICLPPKIVNSYLSVTVSYNRYICESCQRYIRSSKIQWKWAFKLFLIVTIFVILWRFWGFRDDREYNLKILQPYLLTTKWLKQYLVFRFPSNIVLSKLFANMLDMLRSKYNT